MEKTGNKECGEDEVTTLRGAAKDHEARGDVDNLANGIRLGIVFVVDMITRLEWMGTVTIVVVFSFHK